MLDDLHEAGQTIILVTHEEYIAAHAQRIVRLRDGRIESDIAADHTSAWRRPPLVPAPVPAQETTA